MSRELRLESDGPVRNQPAPTPRLVVAFSLVKGDRIDWAVAKLAELGTDEIVPLLCDRTVVRPEDGGAQRRSSRLQRIAREASMQARRVHLPEVTAPQSFAAALSGRPAGTSCLAEPGGGAPSLAMPAVLVGPEGGWSPAERDLAAREGARLVGLGTHVLRVETAAVAAAAILGAIRSGLSAPL